MGGAKQALDIATRTVVTTSAVATTTTITMQLTKGAMCTRDVKPASDFATKNAATTSAGASTVQAGTARTTSKFFASKAIAMPVTFPTAALMESGAAASGFAHPKLT